MKVRHLPRKPGESGKDEGRSHRPQRADDVKRSPTQNFDPGTPLPRPQVGALCWRMAASGLEVLLVTSRETGRWVIPKGWPQDDLTYEEAARREAWEEAGVKGEAGQCLGFYAYDKILNRGQEPVPLPCVVAVYALQVTGRAKAYPEVRQRRTRWFARDKAARKVEEPALRDLIAAFDPDALAPSAAAP